MMEPIYRCGYQIPSLIKLVFKLICFITIPFLITMMVKNLIVTNGIAEITHLVLLFIQFPY